MLKNISPIISPELLKILCEMGHGDEIVIGDGNFPSKTMNARVVRADGHGGGHRERCGARGIRGVRLLHLRRV